MSPRMRQAAGMSGILVGINHNRTQLPWRRGLHYGRPRFSAAISNASIATCHAVVSCSDLGSVKIYRLASSSVRSALPSGKTTGRSKRLSQDTTQLRRTRISSQNGAIRSGVGKPSFGCSVPKHRPRGGSPATSGEFMAVKKSSTKKTAKKFKGVRRQKA
jgi:hypothetical protein